MKMRKLAGKKLAGPKKRSMETLAMIERGGAGAGHHRDRSKYSRKAKHKQKVRYNSAEGMPSAKEQERVRNMVRDDVTMLLGQLNQKLIRSIPYSRLAYQPNELAKAREDLTTFLVKAHFPFFDKQTMPEEEETEVVKSILQIAPGKARAELASSSGAMASIKPELDRLSLLLEAARDAAGSGGEEVVEVEEEETEEEQNKDAEKLALIYDRMAEKLEELGAEMTMEEFGRRLRSIAGASAGMADILKAAAEVAKSAVQEAKKEAKAEAPKAEAPKAEAPRVPRAPRAPRAAAPAAAPSATIGGVAIDPKVLARLQAASGEEDEEEETEEVEVKTSSRRTGSGLTEAQGMVERLRIGKPRGELSAEPYMQFVATKRSSERPPADIMAKTAKDILLYVLPDRTTQVYVKGSITFTFEPPGQGRSSVTVAAKYAEAWRRTGGTDGGAKKSRLGTRIFAAVAGDDRLLLKSEAIKPREGEAVSPMSFDELQKVLKVEGVKQNPSVYADLYRHGFRLHSNRVRHNGALTTAFAVTAAFGGGVLAERYGRLSSRLGGYASESYRKYEEKGREKRKAARESALSSEKAKLGASPRASERGFKLPAPWQKVSIGRDPSEVKWVRSAKYDPNAMPPQNVVTIYPPEEGAYFYAVYPSSGSKQFSKAYSLPEAIELAKKFPDPPKSNPRHRR